MYGVKSAVLLLTIFFVSQTTSAQVLKRSWTRIPFMQESGASGLEILDLDGDGDMEIVVDTASPQANAVRILSWSGSQYSSVLASSVYSDYFDPETGRVGGVILDFEIANITGDDDKEICVLSDFGKIDVFDDSGQTLLESHVVGFPVAPWHFEIAELDDDGVVEFLVSGFNITTGQDSLFVYSSADFQIEWSIAMASQQFEVGDIDADGEVEIVQQSGEVLSGATGKPEWTVPVANIKQFRLVDINNDGVREIVAMDDLGKLTAFDGRQQTSLWNLDTDAGYESFQVADLNDGNGYQVIVAQQSGDVIGIAMDSGAELWRLATGAEVNSLAVADTDNDGMMEVVWSSRNGQSVLGVAATSPPAVEWQWPSFDRSRSYFLVDVGDIDGDGAQEIVEVLTPQPFGSGNSDLTVTDARTHRNKWQLQHSNIRVIEVGNVDATPADEIVIGTTTELAVFDGTTQQLLASKTISANLFSLALADIDSDGMVEILTGDVAGYVTIYDGTTLSQEWQSPQEQYAINSVKVFQCDNDASLEFVYSSYSHLIKIYDGVSRNLEWQGENLEVEAFDIADIDLDGRNEIIVALNNKKVSIIDCIDKSIEGEFSHTQFDASAIMAANIDSTAASEIIILSEKVLAFDLAYNLIWQSTIIPADLGFFDSWVVADIDKDNMTDILFGCEKGIFHYEATIPSVITSAPERQWVQKPENFQLHQNYPNPFNPSTATRYTLAEQSLVTITVYDILGRKIALLVQDTMPPGTHETVWDGRDDNGVPVSSGIYIFRLHTQSDKGEAFVDQRKAVLMK